MSLHRRRVTSRPVAAIVAGLLLAGGTLGGPQEARGQSAQPTAVIVGDSLTGGNAGYIRLRLAEAGHGAARVEGLGSRRIAVSYFFHGYRDSGIERIRRLRADGVEPQLWVIQLGTNDLHAIASCGCTDRVAFAAELIDQLLAELPPDAPVAWVTVVDRSRPRTTETFNAALRARAAADPRMALIRWNRRAVARPEWFSDHVHPNFAGVVAFTEMYVDALTELLANPPGPPRSDGRFTPATRLGPA